MSENPKAASATPPQLTDSDLLWLCIRKLERCAHKMERFEYDEELELHFASASEFMAWAAHNFEKREIQRTPK